MTAINTRVVFCFFAKDKPGIVETLAAEIKNQHGNWKESRLMHLNGLFSGIVSITIPKDSVSSLNTALSKLAPTIQITEFTEGSNTDDNADHLGELELIGPDRPGIVLEVTRAMAAHGINIESMETGVASAAMSGEALFSATLQFSAGQAISNELHSTIDEIGEQLTLDISLSSAQ